MKVRLRGGFSDRNNIKAENTTMQINSLDDRSRTMLANITGFIFRYGIDTSHLSTVSKLKQLLVDVYLKKVDWSAPCYKSDVLQIVNETIYTDDYDAVLSVIEYVVNMLNSIKTYGNFIANSKTYNTVELYNDTFQKEYIGYRIVNLRIVPIINNIEIEEISCATSVGYKEVEQHVDKALSYLSDRNSPDYANSIKESITAVERMCSIIIGRSETLGAALRQLENNGVVIHSALKAAFEKLYGYTSDASGIRHAGQLGGTNSTFEEAKFMLVSCCAFINYLKGNMA